MARPTDRFCVVEVSAGSPGVLSKSLNFLKPTIGIVTCIGTDHYSNFGSQDAIAAEKGRLVRALPEDGIAVLNADDPRVIAMRDDCRARVISFGLAAEADVRAESVSAIWPDRLSFELVHNGTRILVQTQLCGPVWIPVALAAAALGIAMDVSLEDIARSLGSVEPNEGRMSPLVLPDGVTFIRDDWKASMQTIAPALEFLRMARASRKIAVIGTISDYAGTSRTQYVKTARHALVVSDQVIFVGSRSSAALRAKPEHEPDRLRAFSSVKTATAFLGEYLKPGDLVLLKGSNPADHLYRIALSRTSVVSCWRANCRRLEFCDSCELVRSGREQQSTDEERQHMPGTGATIGSLALGRNILVGLGNPGDGYANTPHNVGFAMVDRIATETRAAWSEVSRAQVALVEWRGLPLCLVKSKAVINLSGRVLHELFEQSGAEPGQVVLVFDDIDLPLGKVRSRMRGSDGGHRGVRSILEAFQTDEFRRIKIGVRRAVEGESAVDAVLRPFSEAEKALISAAVEEACSRLQEVIRSSLHDGSSSKARATLPG
jgi:aminoacyl-tRNA hydrolase